jgi:SAM-dependent methyltransferase
MDSSGAMLELLRVKPRAAEIALTLGDVADPAAWPHGPFDLVVAAFNLLFNLSEEGEQASLFHSAAQALAPNGLLVVEAFIPAPLELNERRLSVKEVSAHAVVLIATGSQFDYDHGGFESLRPPSSTNSLVQLGLSSKNVTQTGAAQRSIHRERPM